MAYLPTALDQVKSIPNSSICHKKVSLYLHLSCHLLDFADQELGVALAVGGAVKYGVHVMEDVFGTEGSKQVAFAFNNKPYLENFFRSEERRVGKEGRSR